MPDNYFLSTPEESVPGHFQLLNRFRYWLTAAKNPIARQSFIFPNGLSEVTIVTQDRPVCLRR
jgi:hypothetical protein